MDKDNSFSETLCQMQAVLGCSNRSLQRDTGYSSTSLSRFKSGSRIPAAGSRAVNVLAAAFADYAVRAGKTAELLHFCGADADMSGLSLVGAVTLRLGGKSASEGGQKQVAAGRSRRCGFSERLDAVMKLLLLSNVRLGKAVNIDPSHISRFRNGVRTPKPNSELISLIAVYLLDRVNKQGKCGELCSLSGIPPEALLGDNAVDSFSAWLNDCRPVTNEPAVDRLLEKTDGYSAASAAHVQDTSCLADEGLLSETATVYIGTVGLRRAVIRFLDSCIRMNAPELLLYSDQSLDWLVGDGSFLAQWMRLMNKCVGNGTKIKIVHNIERETSELLSAIEGWLPLYMSGMIEPYCCKRKTDGRFSHTLFLCPEKIAVEAFNYRSFESTGKYAFISDAEQLTVLKNEFALLLADCDELVSIKPGGCDTVTGEKSVTSILNTLSAETMPDGLMHRILSGGGIGSEETKRLLAKHEKKKIAFYNALENGYIHEFIPEADDDAIFSSSVRVDGEAVGHSAEFFYKPEEYAAHIRNIIAISDSKPAYSVFFLPKAPFSNMRLTVTESNVTVAVTKPPYTAFVSSNPLLRQAFEKYISIICKKYITDRTSSREKLLRYL